MAHFLSQNWLLQRRQVLRGAGGALALPLLDCMRPLMAADKSAAKPSRSVFIYMPNGVNTLDYQIKNSGAEYELSKSLNPLQKHRAHITPISGLAPFLTGIGNHKFANTTFGSRDRSYEGSRTFRQKVIK